MKPDDPDLFEWAESRPTGQVIDIVSLLLMRAWRDGLRPVQRRAGDLIDLPPRPQPLNPKRKIA